MKRRISLYGFILITILFAASSAVSAKEIAFQATVISNIIALGQSTQLNLAFEGARDVPRPELPEITGFQIRYLGPSTRMSIVNGRMSSSITHRYSLVPMKTGKFTIGPFSIKYNGDTYKSNELAVEVVDRQTGLQGGQHKRTTDVNLEDRVFLTLHAGKSEAYMNEVVPLKIKLYINSFAVRDIQYPEFPHEGLSADEFGKPMQYKENRGGIIYDVIEFKTQLFGARPGEFTLGPAELQASLLMKRQTERRRPPFDDFFGRDMFDDFFGSYETSPIALSSDELSMKILPFPDEGRPEGFSGAVGNFDLRVEASPLELQEGDPVTLKMIISGKGNFNTVTAPVLKGHEGFKVYDPQMKQEGNTKIFEQVLIPVSADIKRLPGVAFSFFNTAKGQYETISKDRIPIKVAKREKREEIAIVEAPAGINKIIRKEKLGRDIIYIKESPGKLNKRGDYLYKNPLFLMVQVVPVILFISTMIIQRRREKLRTDIVYARRLSAPRKATKGIRRAQGHLKNGKSEEFYESVYKTLQEYIADRYHMPAGGITSDIVDNGLKGRAIDEGILGKLKNIFSECDLARFASSGLVEADMEKTLEDLREVIDHMERHKS